MVRVQRCAIALDADRLVAKREFTLGGEFADSEVGGRSGGLAPDGTVDIISATASVNVTVDIPSGLLVHHLMTISNPVSVAVGVPGLDSVAGDSAAILDPVAWYDVRDLSGVLSNGDPVDTWADKIGSNDWTASGSARPTYDTTLGDNGALRFRTDDWMAANGLATLFEGEDNPMSIAIAAKILDNQGVVFARQTSAGGNGEFWDWDRSNSNEWRAYAQSGEAWSSTTPVPPIETTLFLQTADGGVGVAGPIRLYYGATPTLIGTATVQISTRATSDQYSLGQEFDGASPSDFADMDVYEVAFYDYDLTTANMATIHGVMAARHGY